MRRRVIIGASLVAVCLAVVVTRAWWEGRAALADGDRAADASDYDEAIAKWRRAARWYVPGASHVGDAYDRLETVGRAAAEQGNVDVALSAWRGVRGSILATRSFFTPHQDRLEPANRAIAQLMARQEGAAPDPGATPGEREAWHYELLARDEAPSVGWAIVALLGLALWLGGAFGFALRGISDADELVPRPAALAGAAVAVGLVIWLLGLYKA